MFLLTLRDIQFRKVRFVLVTIGTAVVFAMLFLMSGLTEYFAHESRALAEAVDARTWVVPDGASGPFSAGSALSVDTVRQVPGDATPLLISRYAIVVDGETLDILIIGYQTGSIAEPPVAEGALPMRGQLLLDRRAGFAIGEEVMIGPGTFTVSGLTEGLTMFAGMPMAFLRIADAQTLLLEGQRNASTIVTDAAPEAVAGTLPSSLAALDETIVIEDAGRPLESAAGSVNTVRILLWVVSAMIIGGVVYLSALERRRDFAVLKAVGGSTRGLLVGLLGQGVLIAAGAVFLASGLQAVLKPVFPIPVQVTGMVFVQVPAVAVGVALLASLGGMRQVARTDPAMAFSGPGA